MGPWCIPPRTPWKGAGPGLSSNPPSGRTVQLREDVIDDGAQAISFESYAEHFVFSPEEQAIVERGVREYGETNPKRQREIEVKKASDEMQRREKEKIEKELKEATTGKLR